MMKRLQLFPTLILLLSALMLHAQTNHMVDVQSNFFSPNMLTITAGDTVTWMNLGGFHNVNGSQAAYPDNPEGFINGGASSASWTYEFVFTIPGTYEYQCDPHVGLGMTGMITVEPAAGGETQLLLTGVYDGPLSGGLPKGIEVYVLEDITDLSVYGVGSATNGGGTDGIEYTFPAGSATAGDYLYLTSDEQGFVDFFGFTPDFVDDMGQSVNVNGDDAIELFLNDEVVDIFGEIDVDGTGQPWEYQDGWAYRVNGTGPDGTTFVLDNWIFSGINALDDASDNASASVPVPVGTYDPDGSVMLSANNDAAFTEVNEAVTINVLDNDFLPNPMISLTAENGNDGTTEVQGDTAIIYTPDMDFCGEDSFTYEVCDANSCQTATVAVTVQCPLDYPAYTIAEVTTLDGEGVVDSLEVKCQLQGIVYGVDLQFTGIQFTLIDENNDGIGVFNGGNEFGYTVQEGDEVIVNGEIDQFFGLTQIVAESIELVSSGNTLFAPTLVTELGENTESQLVTFEGVELVDPSEWGAGGSDGFNVELTNGFTLRIDDLVDLFNMPAPQGVFNVTGIGGQFDNEAPLFDGYQLLPRYMEDIDILNAAVEPIEDISVQVYPNPAQFFTILETDKAVSAIRISNALGQEVLTIQQPPVKTRVDLSAFESGVYLLTFIQQGRIRTKELIVR